MKNFLIVVDMQNDFINGSLGSKAAEAIVPNVCNYIKDHKAHIILTRDTHHENYLKTQEGEHLPIVHCIEDTEGWEINKDVMDAVVNSGNTYSIINKPTFGSFQIEKVITKLLNYMQHGEWVDYSEFNGHDVCITLLGLDTDICVISNALILKAAFPEAKMQIIANCCAGVTPESHQAALFTANSCQIEIINNF